MKGIVFYAACATRRMIDRSDIRAEKPCRSFEDACAYERKFMHDDDDWGVMANMDGLWFRVWARDTITGELLVTDEDGPKCGRISAQPLPDYIKNKSTT